MATKSDAEFRLISMQDYFIENSGKLVPATKIDELGGYASRGMTPEAITKQRQRDIAHLKELGLCIEGSADKGFVCDVEKSCINELNLSEIEQKILALAVQTSLENPGYMYRNELELVAAKLASSLDNTAMPSFTDNPELRTSLTQCRSEEHDLTVKKWNDCARENKQVTFTYTGRDGKVSSRRVNPLGVYSLQEQDWYLSGSDVDLEEQLEAEGVHVPDAYEKTLRNFKPSGVEDLAEVKVKGKFVTYDMTRYPGYAPDMSIGFPFQALAGEPQTAVILLAKGYADKNKSPWRKAAYCSISNDPNHELMVVETQSISACVDWLMPFAGAQAVPVYPAELVDAYRARLKEYEGAGAQDLSMTAVGLVVTPVEGPKKRRGRKKNTAKASDLLRYYNLFSSLGLFTPSKNPYDYQMITIDGLSEKCLFPTTPDEIREAVNGLMMIGSSSDIGGAVFLGSEEDGDEDWIYFDAQKPTQPLRLTGSECEALLEALRKCELQDTQGLWTKINLYARAANANGVDELVFADADTNKSHEDPTLRMVLKALDESRILTFGYKSSNDEHVSRRRVEPMKVYSRNGSWYLQAYCLKSNDTRTYRLDRLEHPHMAEVFAPRVLEIKPFDQSMAESNPSARIVFTKPEYFRPRKWNGCTQLGTVGEGWPYFELPDSGGDWLPRNILAHAPYAKVADNPDLIARVGRVAANKLATFEDAWADWTERLSSAVFATESTLPTWERDTASLKATLQESACHTAS